MPQPDYFKNQSNTARWPFSIYHQGIVRCMKRFLPLEAAQARCLNVGCGLFAAYPELKYLGEWWACDMDQRCIDIIARRYPEIKTEVCGEFPELPASSFDIIISTEVIEHQEKPVDWFRHVLGLARQGGIAVFSTPNYGLSLLPLVEYTLLQLVALSKGFSRFFIHPNKYNRSRLRRHLLSAAPEDASITVRTCSLGMALVGVVKL